MKRIYRSLFDSDDVYEVEEISDDTEVSTEDIAEVKHDEDGCIEKKEVHTIEDCWKAIQKLQDTLFAKKSEEAVKDDEPAESNKVEPQKVDIDKSKSVNDNEEEVEEEEIVEDSESEEDKDEKKEVKDAYSKFAKVTDSKAEDLMTATQVAFQNRYNKVANK